MQKNNRPPSASTRAATLGLLLALAAALSFFESSLAAALLLPPGVKPGLSNIPVLLCVFLLGGKSALSLGVLKAFFVFLTRGPIAGTLSLCGGLCSIGVMLLCSRLLPRLSKPYASIAGALAHNTGQIAVACLLLGSGYALYYLPVMILSGIGTGALTGVLFNILLPGLCKIVPHSFD